MMFIALILLFSEVTSEPQYHNTWWFLGPFIVGKTEIDVDPISAYNSSCDRFSILRKKRQCPKKFLSEIATTGYVSWSRVNAITGDADGTKIISIQFPMQNALADLSGLIQGLNKISVVEFQGWLTNDITIERSGRYEIELTPIHSFYIDNILYAGTIYSEAISKTIVYLSKGKHFLDAKVRAKFNLKLSCSITYISDTKLPESFLRLGRLTRSQEVTDIIDGQLPFNEPSWIQLPLSNFSDDWCVDIYVEIISLDDMEMNPNSKPLPKLYPTNYRNPFSIVAPGHTQYIAFQFELEPGSAAPYTTKNKRAWYHRSGGEPCLSFAVVITGRRNSSSTFHQSNTIPIDLRCRRSGQSFVFTLLDHDGSVTHAAALLPSSTTHDTSTEPVHDKDSQDCSGAFPVLLSLSGVGVSARAQVDSHKYKLSTKDKDYTFGFERAWVLAPARGGAHNWEGTGFWTVLHTLDYLGRSTSEYPALRADVTRVVVSGHSRGGHGALTFSTHFPDRVLAVVTASGYMDRENYGDANILFDMDMQLQYMDPLLISVHLAMIHEHDNAQSVSNLFGIDVFVRSGSSDRTVNPFFQRQIARVLQAVAVNVTYSERPGADHWYWDYEQAEDGGVVFDPLTRRFMESHFPPSECPTPTNNVMRRLYGLLPLQTFVVTSHNPSTFGAKFGIKIESMISRLTRAIVIFNRDSSGTQSCRWALRPNNVLSFTITAHFWHVSACDEASGSIQVLGNDFIVNTANDATFCRVPASRSVSSVHTSTPYSPYSKRNIWQPCSVGFGSSRVPHEQGPARQSFQRPFLVVVGTGGSAAVEGPGHTPGKGPLSPQSLLDAAKYVSMGHYLASDTVATVVPDSIIDGSYGIEGLLGHNLVLIGGPDVNRVSHWLMSIANELDRENTSRGFSSFQSGFKVNDSEQMTDHRWTLDSFPPIRLVDEDSTGRTSILFGACNLSDTAADFRDQRHHGVMFTFPLPHRTDQSHRHCVSAGSHSTSTTGTGCDESDGGVRNRVGLMVTADSVQGLHDVVAFSFSSNVPLTRAPFSNMYGDYFVTGPSLQAKGLGGTIATGYFGNDWELDPLNGVFPDECLLS